MMLKLFACIVAVVVVKPLGLDAQSPTAGASGRNPMAAMAGMAGMAGMSGMPGMSGSSMSRMAGMSALMGAGGAGGSSGGLMGILNNPWYLCRQTENFPSPTPCQGSLKGMCDIESFRTYKYPGLMKCSPMGYGCCLKDVRALMLTNRLG